MSEIYSNKYQADDSLDITPFIDFMLQEGCSNDENMSNTVWSFYAEKLQNPLVKNATALALVSDEEAVKDLLLKPFRMLFEYNYFIATDKKQIFGVNIDLENKLLVEIDDSLIAKQDIIKLDSLIKNINFGYQEKAGKILTKANYSSCVITCVNHEFVSSMAKKKMLIVPRVSSAKADDMDYLDSIQKLIDNVAFAPALMHYLLNFPYQDYMQNLKYPPVTKLSNAEIEEGFSTEVKWLYKYLKAGEFTSIGAELVSEGGIRVSSTGSFRNFETFSKTIGEKTTLKVHTFGTKMSNIFSSDNLKKAGQKLSDHTVGDEINAVDYGSLSRCREAFEKYTGLQNPDWVGDTWKTS